MPKLRINTDCWNTMTVMSAAREIPKAEIVRRAVIGFRRLPKADQRVVLSEKLKPATREASTVVEYTMDPLLFGKLKHKQLVAIVTWKLRIEEPNLTPYLTGMVQAFIPKESPGIYSTG